MNPFTTIDPPGIVSYFTPTHQSDLTNVWSGVSLMEQQIESAFQGAQRELGRYEQYQDRWDGYFAEPFAAEVLHDAANILYFSEKFLLKTGLVPTLVTTGPASDGSVDVELQVGDRRLLITLYPKDDTLRVATFHGKEASEQLAPLGTDAVATWLSWLSRSGAVPSGVAPHQHHSR